MAAIHPSLTLVLDLDERLATQDTKLEIRRCYSHIGTPVVRTHKAAGDQPGGNVARFLVSVGTKKYLMSEDEGADALWEQAVEPWIGSMIFNVGNNMAAFNRRMRKIKLPELYFDRFDIELEDGRFVVGLVPDPECKIAREVAAQVGLARTALNEGALEGAVRVNTPAAHSWAEQEAAARALWNEQHAEDKAAGEQNDQDAQPAEAGELPPTGPAKHWVGPMPDRAKDPEAYAQWEAADREAKSYENTAVPPTDSDDLPPIGNPVEAKEAERFSFAVDYSIWDVVFADGATKVFDAKAHSFKD